MCICIYIDIDIDMDRFTNICCPMHPNIDIQIHNYVYINIINHPQPVVQHFSKQSVIGATNFDRHKQTSSSSQRCILL